MKSFGDWLRDTKVEKTSDSSDPSVLPEGVWETIGGKYEAQCISCERYYEIYYDLKDFDPNYSYCGGSPRCCP